jgi:hypothetical protein
MNNYAISSINFYNSYQLWLKNEETEPLSQYLDGVRLKESINHRITELGKILLTKCSGIGGACIDFALENQISTEIIRMKTIRKELKKKLELDIGIVAAFDLSCPDHNDTIRSDILGAVENRDVVITTKSLLSGTGSIEDETVRRLHNTLKETENDYQFWVDDETQYVLMVPKKILPHLKPVELLQKLDFAVSKWSPIDCSSLIESSFAKPKLDTFFTLFSPEPKARKQWIACGHGGESDICGMNIKDYKRFFHFLERQNTDFLFVSSCQSGSHKDLHLNQRTFPVVLGTYTGESFYAAQIKKDFFTQLNTILSHGKPKSARPFEKLFQDKVSKGKNDSIIYLPESKFPFQLLLKKRACKDLYQLDITRAKCINQAIDLTNREKVCIHPAKLDIEVVVGKNTVLFPYESAELVEIDRLRVKECSVDDYFNSLSSHYRTLGSQKGCFLIRDLHGQPNVLWLLDKENSVQWNLSSLNFRDAAAVREQVGADHFNRQIHQSLSSESKELLKNFDSILVKGGLNLSQEENLLFKKEWKLCLDHLFKNEQINSTLFDRLVKSNSARRYLLQCCIKYKRMDFISDLSLFHPNIRVEHFRETIRQGNILLFEQLTKLCPEKMPKSLNDCLVFALEGGEEMMIALYHHLKLTPNDQCHHIGSLFKIAVDLEWLQLVDLMMEKGKPKGKSLQVKDDPLNVLINACQKDIKWKPLVLKAIQLGWNPTDEEVYGHRDLPINRLIRFGKFDLFLALLENFPTKKLAQNTQYLPLSEAIGQTDTRFLEILLSFNTLSVNAEISPGVPLLCKAISQGNHHAVELLIKHGARVQLSDPYLEQPISLAIKTGDIKMINLLLEPGIVGLSKSDYPQLIKLIKNSKNDEETVWQLMFLAYRKPSLYEPNLSRELVKFFYENEMRAHTQWIVGRKDKHQAYNAGFYLDLFVLAEDLQMVREFLRIQTPVENKAAVARVLKKAMQADIDDEIVQRLNHELY